MNHFHNIDLSIPVNTITDAIKNIKPDNIKVNQHWLIKEDIINKEFLYFLAQLNLNIGNSNVLFYTPPFGHLGIHIDGDTLHNNCMINWVWGSNSHKMFWYELISPNMETKKFSNNDEYISIPASNAREIDSQEIKYPSLVKVGVPHSIENYDFNGRWCLSLDVNLKDKNEKIPGIDFSIANLIFLDYTINREK